MYALVAKEGADDAAIPEEVQPLLEEFANVFLEELSPKLSPPRGITISTIFLRQAYQINLQTE